MHDTIRFSIFCLTIVLVVGMSFVFRNQHPPQEEKTQNVRSEDSHTKVNLTAQKVAAHPAKKRGYELIYNSGGGGQITNSKSNNKKEFTNQPSHLTYERVHGGIQP